MIELPFKVRVALVVVDEERRDSVLDANTHHGEDVFVRQVVHRHAFLKKDRYLTLRRMI